MAVTINVAEWEKDIQKLAKKFKKLANTISQSTNNSDDIYEYLKTECASKSDKCKNGGSHLLKLCEERKIAGCKNIVDEGVVKYCKENNAASVCEWLPTTTTTTTSTASPTSSSTGPNLLPFIIGGVVGVIVLLAVAIGLFYYCRKKKKMGKNQTMTGTTTGGTSGTGTGTATGTTTKTGRTQATGTNTCAKY